MTDRHLPVGTVTFLFTDIERSTELLHLLGDDEYGRALARHQHLIRQACGAVNGQEVDTQGDAFFVAFSNATAALTAAVAAQRALIAQRWAHDTPLRVRMGLHTGEPILAADNYVGLDVHRASRICSAGHGGQILLSERAHALVQHRPPDGTGFRDLGEHRLKGLAQPERIFQVVAPGIPAEFPALKSLERRTHNLPQQLTSFVGRDTAGAEVRTLLRRGRLVTLTGPGGAGKTRLALEVAAGVMGDYPHGVWLAELAPLADDSQLLETITAALDVREIPGLALRAVLLDYLRAKTTLLVLDNCEHLVEAAARLARTLLEGCPNLRILATSREGLGVAGEVAFRVASLAHPDVRASGPFEELARFEAIRLFVDRAAATAPAFGLTQANAPAVVRIVHRLEGIPLAIELAASRVRSLSVEQIADRLEDRFRLLTGGGRGGLPHHQTLQAAMDWSYELLAPPERLLLRRLSVFSGGWTLDAAEGIAAGEGIDPADTFDLLGRLVDKSLVNIEAKDGEYRYTQLETIRQYGTMKLREADEAASLRTRHAEWYLAQAERFEPALKSGEQEAALEWLEGEHDNYRTVLEWGRTRGAEEETWLRLGAALHRFWLLRGHLHEGREWLEKLVGAGASPTPAMARALYAAGVLDYARGQHAGAAVRAEEGLAAWRALGDMEGIALTLNVLGNVLRNRGEHVKAAAALEESVAIGRRLEDPWPLAEGLNALGLVARRQGDHGRAQALFEESLALWRGLGDKWGLASSLGHLGVVARYEGDYARARGLHEESLSLRRALGDRVSVASSMISLGTIALEQEDHASAALMFEEALSLCRDLGYTVGIAASIGNLAIIAHYQGDQRRADALLEESKALWKDLDDNRSVASALVFQGRVAYTQGDFDRSGRLYGEGLRLSSQHKDRLGVAEALAGLAYVASVRGRAGMAAALLGHCDALREAIRTPIPPSDRKAHEAALAAIRAQLSAFDFEQAWTEGRGWALDEAIRQALDHEGPPGGEKP